MSLAKAAKETKVPEWMDQFLFTFNSFAPFARGCFYKTMTSALRSTVILC